MLRRYGNDRVYRTTYLSGVEWKRDRRKVGWLRRACSSFAAALSRFGRELLGVLLAVFSAVAGVFTGSTRQRASEGPAFERRYAGGEPVSVRGMAVRRPSRESIFVLEGAFMRRTLLITLATILLISGIAAAPSVAVFASSSTVMLLDEDSGIASQIVTRAATVGELLDTYGIELGVGDIVYPDRAQPLKDGQEILLRRAMSVSTNVDGVARDLRIQAGTVREALAMSGVSYNADDIIMPSLSTTLRPGMAITITRVVSEVVTESRRLHYWEIVEKDKTLYVGDTKIAQQGKEGEKEVDIRIVYHDGQEVSREEVGERVIEAPMHRIVKEGTKEKPKATASTAKASASTANSSATASTGTAVSTIKTDGYKDNKWWVFYKDKQYEKKKSLSVKVTAYTHTGNRTATGTWPSVGTIAVDKTVIPLGTRLYVPGYGIGIAADTGSAIKGNIVDVFFDSYEECVKFGRKSVTIYVIGKPQPREI